MSGENLQKEVSNLYDVALLRLPVAVREMNWLSYLGTPPLRLPLLFGLPWRCPSCRPSGRPFGGGSG